MAGFSCHGCQERTPVCHASCEKYRKEKAEHELKRDAAYKQRRIQGGISGQKAEGVKRALNRHGVRKFGG